MCQNYGHILKPFLQIINMHRSDLANWYRVAQHRLASSTTDDKQKRKSAYFAAAEVSGKLLEEVYGRIGLGKTDAQKIVQDVWNECVLGSPDVPLAIRMLRDLNDYIESNRFTHFIADGVRTEKVQAIYGYINTRRDCVDLVPGELEVYLKKSRGYNDVDVGYRYWQEHDIIKADKNRKDYTRDFKMDKINVRFWSIHIDMAKMREMLGMIKDPEPEPIQVEGEYFDTIGKPLTMHDLETKRPLSSN
jgi:hypothetical protein